MYDNFIFLYCDKFILSLYKKYNNQGIELYELSRIM